MAEFNAFLMRGAEMWLLAGLYSYLFIRILDTFLPRHIKYADYYVDQDGMKFDLFWEFMFFLFITCCGFFSALWMFARIADLAEYRRLQEQTK